MTTESDRELLELAAKAVGIEGRYESWTGQGFMEGIRQKNFEEKCFRVWNPLIYDDHALRLAVKLNIRFAGEWGGKCVALVGVREFAEESGSDPCAATRRAITRAAASIGRGEG